MTDALKKEYTLKISQANKSGLVVILYEMFLNYIEDAERALEQKDTPQFRIEIRRAKGCMKELMNSLDYDYKVAVMLLQLYIYCNKELIKTEISKKQEPLDHVKTVMQGLLEAYRKASESDRSMPVMSNVQTIYAGFTYGKNDICENLDNGGQSRGFLI